MSTGRHAWPQLLIRIPPELKRWVEQFSAQQYSSQSIEIIRALEEKRDRIIAIEAKRKPVTGRTFQANPATVSEITAQPGGAPIHQG